VFLNHTLGLLDYPGNIPGKQNYGLSRFIEEKKISIHTTIYPGGGYEENILDQAVEGLKFLRSHPNVKTIFTNLRAVQEIVPTAYRIGVPINTDFYKYIVRPKNAKMHLIFVGRDVKEKGFDYLIKAFSKLDHSKYHLHIVGNWRHRLHLIKHSNYTYYGFLEPVKLREIYYKCHIVVNPSYKQNANIWNRRIRKRYITLDGFPTTAARDAMSTGCCLISTNPRHDYIEFSPGGDYLDIKEKSPEDIMEKIEYLYKNQDKMLSMAYNGHRKILKFFDSKKVVAFKYKVITGVLNDKRARVQSLDQCL